MLKNYTEVFHSIKLKINKLNLTNYPKKLPVINKKVMLIKKKK